LDGRKRMRSTGWRHDWVGVATAALLLAGCATTRTEPTAEQCALRVGTSGDYAPFSAWQPNTRPSGLDVVLAERLAKDLGCDLELVRFRWPTLLEQLIAGQFDLAASGVTMRAERSLAGTFSRPYAQTGVVALVDRSSPMRSLADLDRGSTRLAVNRGGHLERWSKRLLPRADLRTVDDNTTLPLLLRNGEVDGVISDSAEASLWATPDGWRVLGPFSTDFKALLIDRGRADLALEIDRWIRARENDGWLATLRARYLGDPQADARTAAVVATVAAIEARLSLMPLVARSKRTIAKAVTDDAQERRVLDRARAWSVADGDRVETLFRELIELAKVIQRRTEDQRPGPPLADLRDAIAAVDRQLVREIDRLPRAPVEQWAHVCRNALADLPLRPGEIAALAQALARQGLGAGG